MPHRTIAIGDIHGCAAALAALVEIIEPGPEDTLVMLGDYVDRGPDSRGVLDLLILLAERCRLVPLLGNHEEMFLANLEHPQQPDHWLMYGGQATLDSYGPDAQLTDVPARHIEFLDSCQDYHESETHIFVHASYAVNQPLSAQTAFALRWESLRDHVPGPHDSGKTAIVGHTAQRNGEILDVGHLKCIDTWCYGGGWLTALEVHTGQIWQANLRGELRIRADSHG